jgi:FAD:protein FMN transferase
MPSAVKTVAVARHAMATRFEIVLHGANAIALRAAGEEALDEIERLEGRLSLFRETSEIAHVNSRAALGPVRVSPPVFQLLERACHLTRTTDGAFDITIAPLMRCWGFLRGEGRVPDPDEIAKALRSVGTHLVQLDRTDFTVRFERAGVMLDLGAIGKGYAIDCAVDVLREAGVESAFVHGGTSTAYGLGVPPNADAWKIALPRPEFGPRFMRPGAAAAPDQPGTVLAVVLLRDESLSVSAVWGRSFEVAGQTYGHVIDPRHGGPVEGAVMTAVVAPRATDSDALSTALLVLGTAGTSRVAAALPGARTLVVERNPGPEPYRFDTRGIELTADPAC